MLLNHMDLHVPDVAATRDFFVEFFGVHHIETRGANSIAILRDENGFSLVISKPYKNWGGVDQVSIGGSTYHIGFMLPEKAQVDALYERMKEAGTEIQAEPKHVHGSWSYYCVAPGRILVEVGHRLAPKSAAPASSMS